MKTDRPYFVEACIVSLEDGMRAQQLGADRVEICDRLETEGMTPALKTVSLMCDHLHIPIRIMIRSTELGFEANADDIQEMIDSIEEFKPLPIDGFVIGVMKNNRVDREVMNMLMSKAHPFPVTFHKAIDLSSDLLADLEWINQHQQIDTILTSGGAFRALDGVEKILRMKSIFKGEIMAGGNITPGVLPGLHDKLRLRWYHGRAIV